MANDEVGSVFTIHDLPFAIYDFLFTIHYNQGKMCSFIYLPCLMALAQSLPQV